MERTAIGVNSKPGSSNPPARSNKVSRAYDQYNSAVLQLVETKQSLERLKIKQFTRELTELKSAGHLSDEGFSAVLELVISKYVEREVEYRVSKALSQKLDSLNFPLDLGVRF